MPQNKNWYEMKALGQNSVEIYVYDEIGFWGITAKEFARDLKELDPKDSIDLRINSPGGSVTDGIAIYNLLKRHKARVNVFVDGLAASMASVIAMAGDTITIPENALMMIHNPWGGAMGDADEMRKTADLLDKMKKALISAYAEKTGMEDDEISALMDSETWMTGAEAVQNGFATQTSDAVELAASFAPEKLHQFKASFTDKFTFQSSAPAEKPTEEISMPNATNTPAAPVADNIDLEAAKAKAVADFQAKEQKRKSGIRDVFASFDGKFDKLLGECLEDAECDKAAASAKLLEAIGKDQQPQSGGFGAPAAHAGNGKITQESMVAVLKGRAGLKLADGEMSSDNPYRSMSLVEMARAALQDAGVGVASYNDRMSMVGGAFSHSSSDFGNVLADVAHKSLLKGYDEAPETFQTWTQRGTLSDFKVTKRVGLNDFPSLRQVPEGSEFKHATVGDRGESIVLATYGELFSITRQAIINDDLNALTRIPMKMGMAARRTIGDLVYAILTSNPNMSDGTALFHASRNNLATGAGSALGIDSLKAAKAAMRKQKVEGGKALNITPSYLIVPAALETDADTFMNDTVYPGKNNNQRNPMAGMAEVVTEARLDDTSATAWYLAAGAMYDTIEVAYLDGNESPFLDQMDGWTVDGTTFKARIDAGVSPLDAMTLYKGAGA